MKITFKISLKANERIYVNGAVIRVDRKTSFEFLNDVDFLLENHIIQVDEAVTPLKQLYYVVQIMLMAPNETDAAFNVYRVQMPPLLASFSNPRIINELKNVDRLVHEKKFYEAMKSIRELFPLEQAIIDKGTSSMAENLNATATAMRGADERLRKVI